MLTQLFLHPFVKDSLKHSTQQLQSKAGDFLKRNSFILLGLFIISTITTALYLFNRFIYTSSVKNNLLKSDQGLFYKWKFGSVFYTKKGQGNPILLVHDLTTFSSSYEWHEIGERLSKTNTVYTLDLLGCGRSDKPALTYTSFLYVQLITDFIHSIIGEPTEVIVAGSSGAFILEACTMSNPMINQVILINPKELHALAKTPTSHCKLLRTTLALPLIGTFLYNLFINKRTLTNLLKTVYYNDPDKVTDLTVDFLAESSQKNKAGGKFLYACMTSKLTCSNLFHCLRRINIPVSILSSQGIPNNFIIATEYQQILPSTRIIELENSNYLPHMETPHETLKQIQTLLES